MRGTYGKGQEKVKKKLLQTQLSKGLETTAVRNGKRGRGGSPEKRFGEKPRGTKEGDHRLKKKVAEKKNGFRPGGGEDRENAKNENQPTTGTLSPKQLKPKGKVEACCDNGKEKPCAKPRQLHAWEGHGLGGLQKRS